MGYDDLTTQTLTGESELSLTVEGPVDGYRGYAASVNTGLQQLINNDVFLRQMHIRGRRYIAMIDGFPMSSSWSGDGTAFVGFATRPYWSQTTANSTNPLLFDITKYLPISTVATRIVNFGMFVKGNGHTELPEILPKIDICRIAANTDPRIIGTSELVSCASVSDSSADVSAYQTYHEVTADFTVDIPVNYIYTNNLYFVRILGEDLSGLPYLNSGYYDVSGIYIDTLEVNQ